MVGQENDRTTGHIFVEFHRRCDPFKTVHMVDSDDPNTLQIPHDVYAFIFFGHSSPTNPSGERLWTSEKYYYGGTLYEPQEILKGDFPETAKALAKFATNYQGLCLIRTRFGDLFHTFHKQGDDRHIPLRK